MVKKYPSLFLAMLLHLLLFLFFSLGLETAYDRFEKKSDDYLPAYVENEKPQTENLKNPSQAAASLAQPNSEKATRESIALKQASKASPASKAATRGLGSTSAYVEAQSPESGKPNDEPLLKELSRATAAHLFYPPKAAFFKIKGTVMIGFLIHPNGNLTEISVVKSSGFKLLDDAALSAIQKISPVRDVNLYLTTPRFLVAGIIYS